MARRHDRGYRQSLREQLVRSTSGLSSLKQYWIPERGARMARRDDREYREYLRKEQRSQPGCPARKAVLLQRGQATRTVDESCLRFRHENLGSLQGPIADPQRLTGSMRMARRAGYRYRSSSPSRQTNAEWRANPQSRTPNP